MSSKVKKYIKMVSEIEGLSFEQAELELIKRGLQSYSFYMGCGLADRNYDVMIDRGKLTLVKN